MLSRPGFDDASQSEELFHRRVCCCLRTYVYPCIVTDDTYDGVVQQSSCCGLICNNVVHIIVTPRKLGAELFLSIFLDRSCVAVCVLR